jgi:hypothetical protein
MFFAVLQVTINPDGGEGFAIPGQLNSDHSEMLCCLKKRMRKIVSGDPSVNVASVEALSAKWVALTGSERAAKGEMMVVTPIIEGIVGRVFGKWKKKDYAPDAAVRENQAPEPQRPFSPRHSSISSTSSTSHKNSQEFTTARYEREKKIRTQLRETYSIQIDEESAMESSFASIHSMATTPCATAASGVACFSSLDVNSDCGASNSAIICNGDGNGKETTEDCRMNTPDTESVQMDWRSLPSLVTPSRTRSHSLTNSERIQYNWEELMCAVCWYRVNRTVFEVAEQWELAQKFLNLHGDSAPFIAAAYFASGVDNQSSFVCPGEDEKKMALAFMSHFPEDMEGWYEYNAGLEEPMLGLERADKGCRCIPRHFKKCPTPFDPSRPKVSEGDSKRARRND